MDFLILEIEKTVVSYGINKLLMLPSIDSSCENFIYELERDSEKVTISISKSINHKNYE